MATYRIHRMRDYARQHFKNAAHASGQAAVKPRDFLPAVDLDIVEAPTPYAAWHALLGSNGALNIGDMLENEAGELFLCKYTGFDKAQWVKAETSSETTGESPDIVPAAQVQAPEPEPAAVAQ